MPFADRIYQADQHAEPFWQPNEVGGHLTEDYFGGDLKGIQQKLPYLHEMGLDFIYLNPIFERCVEETGVVAERLSMAAMG